MKRHKNPLLRDTGTYTYCPLTGKRQYKTKGEAEKVLLDIRRKRKGDGSVYLCTQCNRWHTTSEDWQQSKDRKQGIMHRLVEQELKRPVGVKALPPDTLIRLENAKAELMKPAPKQESFIKNRRIMKIFTETLAGGNIVIEAGTDSINGTDMLLRLTILPEKTAVVMNKEQSSELIEALNIIYRKI